jgi:hypothetical protein
MAQACLAFSMLPGRVYRGLSVAGGGGALGIAACDAAELLGLEISPFEEEVRKQVEALLPRTGASGTNPIDVANPYTPADVLENLLRAAAQGSRVDLQVLILLPHHYKGLTGGRPGMLDKVFPYRDMAERFQSVVRQTGKPIVLVMPNPKRGLLDLDVVEVHAKARQTFLEKGLPVFDEIGEAMRAIANVNRYYGRGEAA